jgi:O-antigen/teichoic acid export membrane protein
VLAPFVSQVLLGTAAYATLVRVAMAAVAALSLQVVVMGLLSGRSDTRALLLMAVVGGVFGVVTTFALVPRAGIVGGAIGVAVMVPAGLIAAAWTRHGAYREVFVPLPRPAFDPATAGALLRVGLAALLLGLLELGTPLALRLHYLRVHGISANGLLQAALALAQQVSAALIAYLFYYAFGRVSSASGVDGVRDYTRRHWKALVAVAAAAFGAVMCLAGPLLVLFYSREFAPARPLMAWILFAEFCRVMAQVWSLGALPLGALRTWVAIGVAGPAAYVLAYVLFTPVAGLLALPYAAVVGALVQLATAGILMSRRGVTVRPGDAALLAVSLVGLAALARTVAGAP